MRPSTREQPRRQGRKPRKAKRGAGAHALRRDDRAEAAFVLRKADLADGAGGRRATAGGGTETLHGLRGLGVLPRPAATNLGQRARPSLPPAGHDCGATGLLEEAMSRLVNRTKRDSGQKPDPPREALAGQEVTCRLLHEPRADKRRVSVLARPGVRAPQGIVLRVRTADNWSGRVERSARHEAE